MSTVIFHGRILVCLVSLISLAALVAAQEAPK